MMETALKYREQYGFSVIPVGRNKKPLVKWEEYQRRKAGPDEIAEWYKKFPAMNIGIVTGVISDLAVVDIDTEAGLCALGKVIGGLSGTPWVQTPSGGAHMYYRCSDEGLANNSRVIDGCDLRANGGYVVAPPSISESGKQYEFTVSLEEQKRPNLPDAYINFLTKATGYRPRVVGKERESDKDNVSGVALATPIYNTIYNSLSLYRGSGDNQSPLFVKGRRNADLFNVANKLVKGRMPFNEAYQVLALIALSCSPPFPKDEIPLIVESALKRASKRESSVAEDVERFLSITVNQFSIKDVQAESNIVNPEDRHNLAVVLHKLCKKGVIERCNNQRGVYRKLDDSTKPIDFATADDTPLQIKYPLGIERMFNTLPGNIVLVSGSPDSGKSALLLNIVRHNMKGKMPVNYFSSEMGAAELRSRIIKFGIPLKEWTFRAFERSKDFADVIRPGEINIVDFLELHDEFYRVGQYIKDIFDKLQGGIAVIALQKAPNATMGRGGAFSMEKPRLIINMDAGKAKIVKCKNWVDSTKNPNGLVCDYKLFQGCEFIVTRDWYKPLDMPK